MSKSLLIFVLAVTQIHYFAFCIGADLPKSPYISSLAITGPSSLQEINLLDKELQSSLESRPFNLVDTCVDPLKLPWVLDLISNPFNPYCSECLHLYQAEWKGDDVLIYEWIAANCGFTDSGFTTIYNCDGDTIQHCDLTIAGLICNPDLMINDDSLTNKELIWECEPTPLPQCPTEEILTLTWLNDSLAKYEHLCEAACIEGNSGNFLYKHMVDTNVILELRTTCGDIIRRFYNCDGDVLYVCNSFSFGLPSDCTLPFLPGSDEGELLWSCPTTSSRSEAKSRRLIHLFPTLVSDQVTVINEDVGPYEIAIFNSIGQMLAKINSRSAREIIPAYKWPVGTLFLRVKSKNATEVFKIMKTE